MRATASEEAPPRVTMEAEGLGFKLVNPPGDDDDPFEVQEVLSDSCSDMEFDKIEWGDIKKELTRQLIQTLKEYEDVFSDQVYP